MSLPGTRSPLGNSTNDLHARTPSPAFNTAKTTQSKQVRRKASVRAFRPHVDSSEDLPSEHSSIFEALWVNPSVEDFGSTTAASATGDQPPSPEKSNGSGFSQPQRTTSLNAHSQNVHIPTQLTTITEQKSIATLRPHTPCTIRPKASLISHLSKASRQSLKAELQARRKHSFSLDDLSLFHHSKPKDLLKSSSDESATLPPPPPPAYPNQPLHSPPSRVPTPPGLPTFNTPAAIQYRLPAPRLRFREWFSLTPCEAEERYMQQTVGLPRGVVMRGENGVLVRGRWRPGPSAHTAGLEGHRFHSSGLEVAEVARVRRHGADVSRDDVGAGADPGAAEEGVGRGDGVGAERRVAAGEGKQSRWVAFWEGFCFVCCGVEKGEDGELCPHVVTGRCGRVGQGYAGPPLAP